MLYDATLSDRSAFVNAKGTPEAHAWVKSGVMRAFISLGLLLPTLALAQDAAPDVASIINPLPPRCVGPTTMGGRVTDIAVYEAEPRIFYVASAAGGLFKTINGGITFAPVYDKGPTAALGAVAVCQTNPDIVYLGTGEGTSRNSTSWGDGVYKTTDGGKTWASLGLADTKHISRIVIDPKDPNVVYVGALGHLWGENEDRGVFKTTDGGKSWQKVLYVDKRTGIADLVMDPKNPKTLLAACWERMRYPWNWISGGPGSALMKTTDGGKTWKKITKGIPEGNLGRIGLNYFRKNPKIVIATIENKGGGGFYRSTDGGDSWAKVSNQNPRPFYFSIPRQDPSDENRIYIPGVQILFSDDAGKTFRNFPSSVHVDHHAFWINPNDSNHIIIGEDGGLGQTRDKGAKWQMLNGLAIGQFYAATFDMRKPYWVYGGLQDNGCWGGPTQTLRGGIGWYDYYNVGGGDGFYVQVDPEDWTTLYSESQGGAISRINQLTGEQKFIQPRAAQGEPRLRFNWNSPIMLSPHNSKTVYFAGNRLFKSVNRGDNWKAISPDLTTNDPNKQKPGDGSVSPENTGAEAHCTIVTISESPRKQGLLWVGTDDGLVHVSQDDGTTWTNVTPPDATRDMWCTRVVASRYVEGRAYATFDGHRRDDYNPYVFVTEDFGKTWTKLTNGLPVNHTVHVVREGLRNENLLFLGTEQGLWVSLDRGQNWTQYKGGDWPTVPVNDIVLHPRDGEAVIATHGRSIWTMPVSALEDMTAENLAKDVVLTKPNPVYLLGRVTVGDWSGDQDLIFRNTQPGTNVMFYSKADAGDAKVVVSDAEGNTVADLSATAKKGLNVVNWNAGRSRRRLQTGDYRVTLTVGGKDYVTSVRVEDISATMGR